MKASTRIRRPPSSAAPIGAVRAVACGQGNTSQRRRDGSERRFQLLLAALRPAAGQ